MDQTRIALYARSAIKASATGNTIEDQLALLRKRVEQDGFRLDESSVFVDEGYSGLTLTRPGLERLRGIAASEGIDRVYVVSPERLTRKYADLVLLVEEFQRRAVEVVFLDRYQVPDLLLQGQADVSKDRVASVVRRGPTRKSSGTPRGFTPANGADDQ